MTIRSTRPDDVAPLQEVLDNTGLFPSAMLPGMLGEFLSGTSKKEIWLTCEIDRRIAGFCHALPEALTDRTWNMLAIAICPTMQGLGAGSSLLARLEEVLHEQGQRVLIVDTSGTDDYRRTRAFYQRNGYNQEAIIRDFWEDGADKIVFWKKLN